MNSILQQRHQQHKILFGIKQWPASEVISSGFDELDRQLDGGFPDNAVLELQTINGIGEIRLLMPMLRRKYQGDRLLIFISPPAVMCSQMLANSGITPLQVILINGASLKNGVVSKACAYPLHLPVILTTVSTIIISIVMT
ncbi:MAG: hypothetical protein HRU25_11105 [Psychrobium sp.]|nr:hypothetical protein [Psychrobium sp.]